MQRIPRLAKPLLLAAAMILPVIGTGCAARVRYYDTQYHDYHVWNPGETRAYEEYWAECRKPYHKWTDLNDREQRKY